MCGRYYIPDDHEDAELNIILDQLKDRYKNTSNFAEMKLGEIYPTNVVPVIAKDIPSLMKWGFARFDGKGQIINARLETADEKPMFRKLIESQRCLIPAGCYFEWKKEGDQKQKYAIGLNNPIYMAGLYRYEETEDLPLFVILTRPAAPDIEFIHDRMPVILSREAQKKWLTNQMDTWEVFESSLEKLDFRYAF